MDAMDEHEFLELYNSAIRFIYNELDLGKAEPYFSKLLIHIKEHPENKDFYIQFFSTVINNSKDDFADLISFCMHDLRWKEVYNAVERRLDQFKIPQLYNASRYLGGILDSYEDDWWGCEIYQYYGGSVP